jgi:hypothetical protein
VLWRKGLAAEARQQLEVVVRQNPNHERARQMLTDLRRLPSTLPAPGFER